MRRTLIAILCTLFCATMLSLNANKTDRRWLTQTWNARWIIPPSESNIKTRSTDNYGVYHYRKKITLDHIPESFIVHVSADNRYKLFVNEQLVSLGPARNDCTNWRFETIDLAPHLKKGDNIIAALVWNEGPYRPEGQFSLRTAFIIQGDSPAEEIVNSNKSWKILKNCAYKPLPVKGIKDFYIAPQGEDVDMNHYPHNWLSDSFDDSSWDYAATFYRGLPKGGFEWERAWMLTPSPLPQMELSQERFKRIRRVETNNPSISIQELPDGNKKPIVIPAYSHVKLLLDNGVLTNAYFNILFSKGQDATVDICYAEALYDKNHNKGNRNDITDKQISGLRDRITANSDSLVHYTTLWWRCYRYVELDIHTKNEDLIINDIYGDFTAYPFIKESEFISDSKLMSDILETGWRSARLCAFETYMDCPYYEQLQYIGDTRIQALISYFNTTDYRLAVNAIDQLENSQTAEGLLLSRYPAENIFTIIPPFSLSWIGMLYDHWRYVGNQDYIAKKLRTSRRILDFFSDRLNDKGTLGEMPYWNFIDWTSEKGSGWDRGMPPKAMHGGSAVMDLNLLWTYRIAAAMEEAFGIPEYAHRYTAQADRMAQQIHQSYWDASKSMYADTESHNMFSQHANALAILAGICPPDKITDIATRILRDSTLTQASIYFKYYIHQALIKAGMGDQYINWLDIWKRNLKLGMSTWGETSQIYNTRSDCHAWGATPNIEAFRTILGIDSDGASFSKIIIQPHLNGLTRIKGCMPHPNGKIEVEYHIEGSTLHADILLPDHTEGKFIFQNKSVRLKPGINTLKIHHNE